jgi:HEAT repeat protein/beta-lactamase regulating signal transducer with metallopeptidase domain
MHEWLPFLLDSALKGTIVLGLAGLAASWLRRGSAASRHLVWHVAVIGLLALPIISAALPARAHIAVLPRLSVDRFAPPVSSPSSDDNELFQATSGALVSSASGDAQHSGERDIPDVAWPQSGSEGLSSETPASSTPRSLFGFSSLRSLPLPTLLFVVWALGALLVLARYALGTLVVHWFTWRAKPINAIAWASLNETMSFAVGLGHPVKLLKSARATTPMTFGVLNPVVLLPNDAEEWGEERRRVVLLHELAHVQRLDCLTNIFATVACAIYWFNPFVWIAVARMRAEGERACDDWVLRAGMRASVYAEHLLDMVKTIGRLHTPAAALPMAQRSTFEGRLLAILEPDMNRNGTRRGQALLLTSVIAIVVLPLAAITSPAAATNAATPEAAGTTADAVAKTEIPISAALTKLGSRVGILNPKQNETEPLPVVRPDVSTKSGAWSAQQVPEARINALIGALADTELDVRRMTIRTLGELGDPRAVAALSAALRTDKDPTVRRAAAWALGQIGDDKGVAALSDAIKSDSDLEVRRTSVWAVGQIGSAAATPALAVAVRDNDKDLRANAVWAIGQIGDASGVAVLATSIKDADASIRNQSAWALGQIGEDNGVSTLTAALKDSDEQVRSTAVWALGQIGADAGVAPLVPLLSDNDAGVRHQAAWALGQIGSERAVAGISSMLRTEQNADVRETGAWALGQINDESAVPALAGLLKDASASVRSNAAWAIGQISDDKAPQALIDAMRDENVDVRRTVVWALGQIEDPKSVDALRAAMKDSDAEVKRGALRALARIGDESAFSALSEMLKDPDPAVRKQAASMMGGRAGGWVDPRPRPRPQPRPAPRPRPNGW